MAEDELELRRVFSRRIDYMMESVGGGIFGGLIFVFLGHLIFAAIQYANIANVPVAVIGLFLSCVMYMLVAAIFFGLAMLLSTLFVNCLNWSFGYILSTRHAIMVSAGLAGFVFGSIPFVFILIQNAVFQSYVIWESLFLFFPIGATIVCSISAAWHESKYTRRYYGVNFDEPQGVQLNIRHLMAGMLWISILMAFSTVIIGNHWPVILFLVFTCSQGFMLLIDSRLESWKRRRREKRARRLKASLNSN